MTVAMRNIIITGKPGSGKGTQAALLAQKTGLVHISTGDIFRDEMRRQTPLGISITESMNAGQYTSDEITNQVVANRLQQDDVANGFILDGYPRTVNQVEFLDDNNITIDLVLNLDIDSDVAMRRLLARAQEQNRGDDTENVIRARFDTYEGTVPLVLNMYRDRNLVVDVSAVGKVADINQHLVDVLK